MVVYYAAPGKYKMAQYQAEIIQHLCIQLTNSAAQQESKMLIFQLYFTRKVPTYQVW